MKKEEFYKRLDSFKESLEKQYLAELECEIFTLNDYGDFKLLLVNEKTSDAIKKLFIDKFSDYKIGDKFQKIKTDFYKLEEKVSKSLVWKIYDISIFQSPKDKNIYEFTYYCVDANDNYFPKTQSFTNLKAVDLPKIKYYYEKISNTINASD